MLCLLVRLFALQILRDNDKIKPSEMKGMTGGYDSHVLEKTRICVKSWKYVTLQHFIGSESRLQFYLDVIFLIKLKFMVILWAKVP